jgi:succinate dehydrogenase (ubiquinone) flavoprotein subunit
MGGTPTNWKAEVIRVEDNKDVVVPGLFAAGETACASVHGANRLGANSLLDLVVFGRAAAETIKNNFKPDEPLEPFKNADAGAASVENLDKIRYADGNFTTAEIRLEMQKTMQKHAAVFRDEPLLQEGCDKTADIYKKIHDLKTFECVMVWYNQIKLINSVSIIFSSMSTSTFLSSFS